MLGEKLGEERGMVVSADKGSRCRRGRIRHERAARNDVPANGGEFPEAFVEFVNRSPFGPVFETLEVESQRFGVRMGDVGADERESWDFFSVLRRSVGHEIRIPGFLFFRERVAQIFENAAKRAENLRESGKTGHRV